MSYYAFGQVNEWEQARQEQAARNREGVTYTMPDPSSDDAGAEGTDVQAPAPSPAASAPSGGAPAPSDSGPEPDYPSPPTGSFVPLLAVGLGLALVGYWVLR